MTEDDMDIANGMDSPKTKTQILGESLLKKILGEVNKKQIIK
jgi:hypothetical protein